jgi:hypothetical protein
MAVVLRGETALTALEAEALLDAANLWYCHTALEAEALLDAANLWYCHEESDPPDGDPMSAKAFRALGRAIEKLSKALAEACSDMPR